jgi:hypothetical protein
MSIHHWLRLAAVAMLLAAFGKWPYDYYTLLRLLVCGVSIHEAYRAFQPSARQDARGWAFGAFAALFNPFVPVHLARSTWNVIDLGVGIALAADLAAELRANRAQRSDAADPQRKRKETQTG